MPKHISKKNIKSNKKSRQSKTQKGGKKYKTMWCSQAIVNLPRMDCLEKNCTGSKTYKDNLQKLANLNKQYDAFVSKKCNLKLSKSVEVLPETEADYACNSAQRKGKLFKTILKLENETSIDKCEEKHCAKEDDISDDCIDLGEIKCREKYKDLIETMRKTKKRKILPLEECNP